MFAVGIIVKKDRQLLSLTVFDNMFSDIYFGSLTPRFFAASSKRCWNRDLVGVFCTLAVFKRLSTSSGLIVRFIT